MGTHPIFESDFDCLTDVCFVLNQLKMRYVAAYLLAQLGGNDAPDAAAIKAILGSVGVDADEEMNKVISELSGKAIADVLAEGKEKLASVPSGGGAAPAAGAAAAGGAEEAPAAEAKKESSSEDEDEDMGFGLFD